VNTTRQQQNDLHITARIVSPADVTLDTQSTTVTADANNITPAFQLPVASLTQKDPLAFVRLEMRNAAGTLLADNFYWVARDPASYRGLDDLAPATIDAQVQPDAPVQGESGQEDVWSVRLRNTGADPSVAMKLTLFHPNNTRILPAYYSDNYISLLPGEERTIVIHAPSADVGAGASHFTLRGWNLPERTLSSTTGAPPSGPLAGN
jgi:hypothetical protein